MKTDKANTFLCDDDECLAWGNGGHMEHDTPTKKNDTAGADENMILVHPRYEDHAAPRFFTHGHTKTAASAAALLVTEPSPEEKRFVQSYVDRFRETSYQLVLARLYKDRGTQDPEVWAARFYKMWAQCPDDPHYSQLNTDRRTALQLIYDMMNDWKERQFSSSFERAMATIFQRRRFEYILGVTLVLDRAHALYKLQHPTARFPGLHWFSKHHIDPVHSPLTAVHRDHLAQAVQGYPGSPTMNWRLLRLCCQSPQIGLQEDSVLQRWCQPVLVPQWIVSRRLAPASSSL